MLNNVEQMVNGNFPNFYTTPSEIQIVQFDVTLCQLIYQKDSVVFGLCVCFGQIMSKYLVCFDCQSESLFVD